ncbi:MAG: NAD(P)-dependent oxidoreductase [Dehalococcoidia bacterium]
MRALILAPFSDRFLARLRRSGEVTYESWLDTQRIYGPDELGARIAGAGVDVLVVEADFVFEELFDVAPGLRLIGVCRNALNQIDVKSATEHGVVVTQARGRNTNAVAEMTLALMLALARQIPRAHAFVSGGAWRDPVAGYRLLRGTEIAGSTVGIIGCGQIGRAVVRKCVALGARVLAYDPLVPPARLRSLGAAPASLADIARRSDWVTVHVPVDEGTAGMIDSVFLGRMRPTAYVINTSGGPVVDTGALVAALASGRIAGAALDVFDGHPLPLSSPLLSAPNVILTPHIGGATAETVERQSRIMTSEIERLLAGRPLRHAVNPEADPARGR